MLYAESGNDNLELEKIKLKLTDCVRSQMELKLMELLELKLDSQLAIFVMHL